MMMLFGFDVYLGHNIIGYRRTGTRTAVKFAMRNKEYDILRNYDWQRYYELSQSVVDLSVPITPKLKKFDTNFINSIGQLRALRDEVNMLIAEAIADKNKIKETVSDIRKNGLSVKKPANDCFTVEDKDGYVRVTFDNRFNHVNEIWVSNANVKNGGDAVVAGFRLANILITFNSNKEKYDNDKRAKEVSTEESRSESTAA